MINGSNALILCPSKQSSILFQVIGLQSKIASTLAAISGNTGFKYPIIILKTFTPSEQILWTCALVDSSLILIHGFSSSKYLFTSSLIEEIIRMLAA